MKNSLKKSLAFIMAMTMAFTGIGFGLNTQEADAAVTFTDLSSSHWAASEIAFAAEKGIVNGYPSWDGTSYTFQPESSVSYEEAATMLYRALDAAGNLRTSDPAWQQPVDASGAAITLAAKHASVLDDAGIADWAKEYVAYGLEFGIIAEEELGDFVNDETKLGNPAPRITVAVWTAKAFDKNLAGVVNLPFTDASLIDDEEAVYVDMLYRHGIMKGSLQLDGTVAFQPDSGVKRSEFAAIANRIYNNVWSTYDPAKETFTYKTSEENSFFEGAQIRIIGSLKTEMIGEYKPGVTVSGMTFIKNETPQAHYIGAPEVQKGKISSLHMLWEDTLRVTINVDGKDISYLLTPETVSTAKIKEGTRVTFIADGINLIEIK
ncbi:MAG: S-layer homology domain-containing protein [Firmicutes bacterium]|nr:S-layer homology domain-containing protein [Bacillota bacterium]